MRWPVCSVLHFGDLQTSHSRRLEVFKHVWKQVWSEAYCSSIQRSHQPLNASTTVHLLRQKSGAYVMSHDAIGSILAVQVAVLRLLQQLGQVYSVMKIDSLKALVPFMNFGEVEAVIVDAVKNEFIQVSAPHPLLGTPAANWMELERLTDRLPASVRVGVPHTKGGIARQRYFNADTSASCGLTCLCCAAV